MNRVSKRRGRWMIVAGCAVLVPALVIAGRHNRALLAAYVEVEQEVGWAFRDGLRLADIVEEVDAAPASAAPEEVESWEM